MSTPAYEIAVITRVPEPLPYGEYEMLVVRRSLLSRLRHRLLKRWWVWADYDAVSDRPVIEHGNLAHGTEVYLDTQARGGEWDEPAHCVVAVNGDYLMTPVFRLGEILFLGLDYEREVIGDGRKPRKWDVDYEYVDTLDEAIALSRKVTGLGEAAA